VRYAPGVDAAAVQRDYRDGEVLSFEPPQPGGEVQRFSEVDRLPRVVVVLVALLGAVTVAHAMGVTVARRRRELATLATLGFTRPSASRPGA
jgi:predicted lysophospholipase L1 biosynthesis ABC-type transport system permease subunit